VGFFFGPPLCLVFFFYLICAPPASSDELLGIWALLLLFLFTIFPMLITSIPPGSRHKSFPLQSYRIERLDPEREKSVLFLPLELPFFPNHFINTYPLHPFLSFLVFLIWAPLPPRVRRVRVSQIPSLWFCIPFEPIRQFPRTAFQLREWNRRLPLLGSIRASKARRFSPFPSFFISSCTGPF